MGYLHLPSSPPAAGPRHEGGEPEIGSESPRGNSPTKTCVCACECVCVCVCVHVCVSVCVCVHLHGVLSRCGQI